MVGTPPAAVTFSASISLASGSPWRKRLGVTRSAPVNGAACASPQAFAWNIGTTGRTRSVKRNPMLSAIRTAIEWSGVERCE